MDHRQAVGPGLQEHRLAHGLLALAEHRDIRAHRLVAVADGTDAHQALAHAIAEGVELRLGVDHAGRQQHLARGQGLAGREGGEEMSVPAFQALDRATQYLGPEPPGLAAQALQQFLPAAAVGEAGQVVAAGDPGGAALMAVDHLEASPEAPEVDGGRQARGARADDQGVERFSQVRSLRICALNPRLGGSFIRLGRAVVAARAGPTHRPGWRARGPAA